MLILLCSNAVIVLIVVVVRLGLSSHSSPFRHFTLGYTWLNKLLLPFYGKLHWKPAKSILHQISVYEGIAKISSQTQQAHEKQKENHLKTHCTLIHTYLYKYLYMYRMQSRPTLIIAKTWNLRKICEIFPLFVSMLLFWKSFAGQFYYLVSTAVFLNFTQCIILFVSPIFFYYILLYHLILHQYLYIYF